jgi:uncharacterized iron-regulated membrane protein
MKKFRTVVFWLHLLVAVIAGAVIAIMSVTGLALTFRPQILAWAEGAPAEGQVRVIQGRDAVMELDRHGELRPVPGGAWREGFHLLLDWHRALGANGERRDIGRAFTGACNAAFLFLAISGLYLWWPRRWTARALRSALWFRGGVHGKARDRNWHDVFGFWSLPALVVITASGMMISYKWATALVYRAVGEAPPPVQRTQADAGIKGPPKPPGTPTAALADLVASAKTRVPGWRSITVRMPPGGGAAVTVTVKEHDAWPLFATRQLTLDRHTAVVLRDERFTDATRGRRLRSWLRYLHTGEALGVPGQIVAGLASLGGAVLVWTGLALTWRRFRRRRASPPGSTP